jgi:hypothetical protein
MTNHEGKFGCSQGLKPAFLAALGGTPEGVPFQEQAYERHS